MPTTNPYIGAEHLASSAVGELQRTNNFLVEISGLDSNVSFLIKGVPLPSDKNDVITVRYGNSLIKLPGPMTFDSGSLTIYDSIDLDTEKVVSAWRDKVCNKTTKAIFRAATYKKDGTITQYAPDGTAARVWKLHGVWPSEFNPGDLDQDSANIKTMSIKLEWDWAERA